MRLGETEPAKLGGHITEMPDNMSDDERIDLLAPAEIGRFDIEPLSVFKVAFVAMALSLGHEGAHQEFGIMRTAGKFEGVGGKRVGLVGAVVPARCIDPVHKRSDILLHGLPCIADFHRAGD